MWSYYGSKSKIIKKYPKPDHDLIIEPFAGSARYALEYWDKNIILIDKSEIIVKLWKFLQNCSPNDILSLPKMNPGQSTDEFSLTPEEKMLMGFMVAQGVSYPRKSVSKVIGGGKMNLVIERDKQRIADGLYKIKNWKIILGDYNCLNNLKATWFIDPPYQFGGEHYVGKLSNRFIDFKELAEWSKSRIGQVIVCENSKADWMEFKFLSDLNGSRHSTKEVIWYKNDDLIA